MKNNDDYIKVGDIIREQHLTPNKIKVAALAREINVSRILLDGVINNRFRLTTELAVKIGIALDTSPIPWIEHQAQYEVEELLKEDYDITPRFWEKEVNKNIKQ